MPGLLIREGQSPLPLGAESGYLIRPMATPKNLPPPGFEDEAYDFASPTDPKRFYMIASTPRSGSTLLAQHLWRSGIMGAPHEYFGFYSTMLTLVARLRPDNLEDYLTTLLPLRTTANGVFGLKTHYDHLQFMMLSGILTRFGKMHVVYIERRDHMAQAVSQARALRTGQWNSLYTTAKAEPVYNPDTIRWCIKHLDGQRRGWQSFFEQHKISPIRIDYDLLAADPAGIASQVIAKIGPPASPVTAVDLPAIERQADDINAEWIARFKRDSA